MNLAEIRARYPQYEGYSDQQIADAMYQRYYADADRDQFNAAIGYKPEVGGWAAAGRGAAKSFLDTGASMAMALGGGIGTIADQIMEQIGEFGIGQETPEDPNAQLNPNYQPPAPYTSVGDLAFESTVDPLVRAAEAQALNPDTETFGLGDEMAFAGGYVGGMIPQILAGGYATSGSRAANMGRAAMTANTALRAGTGEAVATQLGRAAAGAPAAIGASQAYSVPTTLNRARQLTEQGVDPADVGAASAANYLSHTAEGLLPAAVPGGILTRALTGAGLNVPAGVGQRALEAEALGPENAQFAEDPFDTKSMVADALLSAFFGWAFGSRAEPAAQPNRIHSELNRAGAEAQAPGLVDALTQTITGGAEAPRPAPAAEPAAPAQPRPTPRAQTSTADRAMLPDQAAAGPVPRGAPAPERLAPGPVENLYQSALSPRYEGGIDYAPAAIDQPPTSSSWTTALGATGDAGDGIPYTPPSPEPLHVRIEYPRERDAAVARQQNVERIQGELGEVKLPPGWSDPRLKRLDYRETIKTIVEQEMVPDGRSRLIMDEDGRVTGRTGSQQVGWAQGSGVSRKQAKIAVDKALAGQRLGKRQVEVVQWLLDQAQGRRFGDTGMEPRFDPERARRDVIDEAVQRRDRARVNRQIGPAPEEPPTAEPLRQFEDEAYDPNWDTSSLSIADLMYRAQEIDPAAVEAIPDRASEADAARMLWDIIEGGQDGRRGADQPLDDGQAVGPRAARPRYSPEAPGAGPTIASQVGGRPTVESVRAAVEPARAGLGRAVNIQIVETADQLPFDVEPSVKGALNPRDGTVYLVASNLNSTMEAQAKLLHEVSGHYGLRGLLGDRLNPVLDQVYQQYAAGRLVDGPSLDEIASTYGLDLNTPAGRREAAEEYIAHAAETGIAPGFLDRVLTQIRNAFRILFPDMQMSPAEIRQLVADSRRYTEGRVDGVPRYARGQARGADAGGPLYARRAAPENQGALFDEQRQADADTGRQAGRPADLGVRRKAGTLFGSRIPAEIAETGRASLKGAQIRGSEDLATLAQVYRNPRYETLHYVFMRGDEVAAHTAVSSRLPGSAQAFIGAPSDAIADINMSMQSLGADGYYLVHNHPSGNPAPSQADQQLTRAIAQRVPGFRGHVVINHRRYATIDDNGLAAVHDLPDDLPSTPYDLTGPAELPHPVLGSTSITGPVSLARVWRTVRNDVDEDLIVIGQTREGVSGLMGVRLEDAEGLSDARMVAYVRDFARATGSNQLFLTGVPDEKFNGYDYKQKLAQLIRTGMFQDIISESGQSLRLIAQRLSPDPQYDLGSRLKARRQRFEDTPPNARKGEVGFWDDAITPDEEIEARPVDQGVGRQRPLFARPRDRVSQLREDVPGYKQVDRYLTDPERQKLNRGTAAKVVEVFKRLPSGTEMASVALAGSAKRGWYRESARALLEVFGERDAPRFSALLAALSPQTSVESNLTNALRTWVTWTQYQRPTDRAAIIKVLAESVQGGKGEESILPSWINNTVRALQAEDPANVVLSGPKVDSFRRNLNAEFEHVTNDAWMANYALVEQTLFSGSLTPTGTDPGKGPGYVAMSARVRQAARELTKMTGEQWTPAEVQETVWSWAKAAYEMAEAAGETRSVRQIIEDQALTSDIINSVPDFAGLFNEGRYRQILEEAGYGPELARLERGADAARADRAGAAPAESGTAGETAAAAGSAAQAEALINPRHLQRAASRLDRLREARRSEDGPRFARERPLSKISEAYQEAADRRVWQPVAAFTTRILSKVKLANDTPPEFRRLVRQMRAKQQIAAEQAANVAKHGRELDPDLRKVVSDYIEGEMKVGTVPPQVVTDIATMMQVAHKAQGKRLVELGMLAPESHERLSGAGRYLARYYTKHILNNPFDRALRTTIRQGIQGDRLRGRGTFEPIKAGDWPQYKALGWQLRGMDDAEVRDLGRDTEIRVWRDWTKAEREKMGEIRDAVYRYTRGYMEASRDIAMGELFADMVERGIAKNSDPGGGYHQVPATQIPGTGVQRYGKLAGKWVPDAVWDDLKVIRPEDPGSARATLTRAYLKALALWKEGKTSLNPVVHGNNIVSNVIMADLAGISPWDGKAYYRAAKEYMRKGKLYREAQEAGLFGTEFYGQEIRQMLPELDQFRDIETASAGWFTKGVDYAYRYSGAKAYRDKMGRMYEAEDQYFKMLVYMDQRAKGADPQKAVDEAERWFFNYADVPEGVRAIKATAAPFFSYTYKAIPAMAYAWVHTPWRFAKWAALFGGMNWYAYEQLFGDEAGERQDIERGLLPGYMEGGTAFPGIPKSMRLPTDSESGNPLFLDLSRRMPLGDLFDLQNQAGGLNVPAPFMPSGPVLSLFSGLFMNKDPFTGREVVGPKDKGNEAEARAAWLARQLLPNTPVLPGSYSFNKVMNGIAGSTGETLDVPLLGEYTGEDYYGRKQNLPRALLDTLTGTKIREVDLDRERQYKIGDLRREQSQLRGQLRSVNRDARMGERAKEKRIEELRQLLQDNAQAVADVPVP